MTSGAKWGTWLAAALIGLMAGCGNDGGDGGSAGDTSAPAKPGIATVDARGGEVTMQDGASIQVAAGSLSRPTTVSIARDANGAPPFPAGLAPAGSVYAITPHSTTFATPATVRLPFDRQLLAAGERPALLKADPNGAWRLIDDVGIDGDHLVARVDSLSYFLPIGASWPIVPVPATGPTEAQFVLELDNASFPTLTAAPGVTTRLRQQPDPGQAAALRVTYIVPSTASLLRNPLCTAPDAWVSLRLNYATATIYRVPGETGSRIARGLVFLDDRFGFVDASNRGRNFNHTTSFNPLDWRYLLVDDRPAAPPGSIDDGGAFVVDLQISCSGVILPPPSTPIAISAGYPDVATYITVPPQPVAVMEGADILLPAVGVRTSEERPVYERRWQISDTAGANFSEVPPGYGALDDSGLAVDPGVYGFFVNEFDGSLVARARPADNGRLLRAVVCTTSSYFPGTNIECLTSAPARLTVSAVPPSPPRFNLQPPSVTLEAGHWLEVSAGWEASPAPVAITWQTRANPGVPWRDVDPALYDVLTRPGSDSEWRGTTRLTLLNRMLALSDNGTQFRATFSTSAGTATSDAATISVVPALVAPAFTVQPADTTLANGLALQLVAAATGSAPLSYQWKKDGVAIVGANAQVLVIDPANTTNSGLYTLEVSNRVGTLRSRDARVTVTPTGTPGIAPLAVTRQPQATGVGAGGTAAFVASFSGNPTSYQWVRNGVAMPGENGPALVIANVTSADEADYALLASNALGALRSDSARLSVIIGVTPSAPPAIATQPVGLAVVAGQTATLAVATTGSGPLTYQWQRDGTPLAGATGPVLTLADVKASDAGSYRVVVGNATGSATSDAAGLLVTPIPGAPSITSQPMAASVAAGQPVSFTLAVTGNPAPLCLWMRNGIAIAGATSCTGLTLTSAALGDNGAVISVIAYNSGGFVLSSPAVLTVFTGAPPAITTQPTAQAWGRGTITFSVGTSGAPAPTIDWAVDRERIGTSGRYAVGGCSFDFTAGGGTLTLSNVTEACIGSTFMAIASNLAGRVESNTVELIAPGVFATRIAGLPGSTGSADGPPVSASFNTPNYLTQARDGRIAIGDFGNSTIRLVATSGDVSTLAGSPGVFGFADGSGSAARFNGNGGVAYDSAGNLFVSDWDNHVIRRITPAGVVSTFAGTAGAAGSTDGTGAAARFSNPNGLAIDAADNVYVVDWGNHTLRKITPAGVVSTLAGSPGAPGSVDGTGASARFRTPGAVAVDAAGNLYVADMFNHAIRKVTPAGAVSTLAGTLGLSGHVDGTGSAARFEQPAWIAATADGTLFVVSAAGDTVRRVSNSGVVSTVVGVAGDNATLRLGSDPRLRNARGVWAVSSTELLLSADQALVRVRLP